VIHIKYLLELYLGLPYRFFSSGTNPTSHPNPDTKVDPRQRTLLKSKIHRATVTGADLNYEGSVTIDPLLLEAADIREFEQVQIYDISNGNRLTTYAIAGRLGEGEICINGAAAHLVSKGDLVILASYAVYDEAEATAHEPRLIRVDRGNRPVQPPLAVAGSLRGGPRS
jgi:aspartate 1-decarboxylase